MTDSVSPGPVNAAEGQGQREGFSDIHRLPNWLRWSNQELIEEDVGMVKKFTMIVAVLALLAFGACTCRG